MTDKRKITREMGKIDARIITSNANQIIEVYSEDRELNVWIRLNDRNFCGKFIYAKDRKSYWEIDTPKNSQISPDTKVYATLRVNDYTREEEKWWKLISDYSKSASVVVPSFNRGRSLEYLLTSLTDQTYPKELYEVIVSDYGSNDSTSKLVNIYQSTPKFNIRHVLSSYTHGNPSKSRNEGIKASSGEVVICIDADMVADPKLIEEHMKYYHWSENMALIGRRFFIDSQRLTNGMILKNFSQIEMLRCKSLRTNEFEDSREERYKITDMFRKEGMPWFYFSTCNASFRREDALNAGLFDESFGLWGYEDNEFAYRLFYHRPGIYIVPAMEAIAYHQEHSRDMNILRTGDKNNFEKLFETIKRFQKRR